MALARVITAPSSSLKRTNEQAWSEGYEARRFNESFDYNESVSWQEGWMCADDDINEELGE